MTTAYNVRSQLERSGEAKRPQLLDPGSASTVRVFPLDFSTLTIATAGTRTLQDPTQLALRNSVLVCSTVAAAVVSASSITYTLNAGEWALFVVTLASAGTNQWSVEASGGAAPAATKVMTIAQQEWKKGTDLAVNLGAATTAILGLITGPVATDAPYLQTNVATGSVTQKALTQIRVPLDYKSGHTLTFRVPWTRTVAATTSAALNISCYRAAAPTVDIGTTTGATDVNSAASGTTDFTITPTNVVPGELLYIQPSIAIVSGAASVDIRLSAMSLVYASV